MDKVRYIICEKGIKEILSLGFNVEESFHYINAHLVRLNNDESVGIRKKIPYVFHDGNIKVNTQINNAKNFINVCSFYDQGFYGKGINIAVIDTGVEQIFDLSIPINRIIYFKDFTENSRKYAYDDNGHGTFVSGLIAGSGLLSFGKFSGVAPMSNIIMLKALDKKGEGVTSTILKAMEWILENKTRYRIKVACMSFGSDPIPKNDALCFAVNKLWDSGIVVVTAGGNDGPDYGTIKSPGISSKVITVGALDKISNHFKIADFSSRGNKNAKIIKPDILAPGTEIISNSNKIGEEDYTMMSGTSVSTPIVAGVCALFCEKYPCLKPTQIKHKLLSYAVDIGEDKFTQGSGVLVLK